MTIHEYLNSLPDLKTVNGKSLRDAMSETMDIWSNNACIGYCLDAMERAGVSEVQCAEVLQNLWTSFDTMTIDEAESRAKQ